MNCHSRLAGAALLLQKGQKWAKALKMTNLLISRSIAPIFSGRNPYGINRGVRKSSPTFLAL